MVYKFKGKNIAVFGLGKAGQASVELLLSKGALIHAWDDNSDNMLEFARNMVGRDVTIAPPETYLWACIDRLVLSPGIPFTHPKPHPIIAMANKVDCPIICDVELLYLLSPESKFIGITGTNGKSTTTALIGHVAKEIGLKCAVGGNIGVAASSLPILGQGGVYILEMSSYQLDLLDKMKFDVAILLNITPDHIDRHGNVRGYIEAKKHIFDRQSEKDFAVISVDTANPNSVYKELQGQGEPAPKLVPLSLRAKKKGGIYIEDGVIHDDAFGAEKEIFLGEVKSLKGSHNLQNIEAAYAAMRAVGVDGESIISAIKTFSGLEHRFEFIDEKQGLVFVNDSKATNAIATENALKAVDGAVFWIAGGVAKEGGILGLKGCFSKINHACLIGQASAEFAKTLKENKVAYSECGDLSSAFKIAIEHAEKYKKIADEKNITILLSPACASFDQFDNFEQRGQAFIELIEEYAE